jgi:serine/threonine-protein kinase
MADVSLVRMAGHSGFAKLAVLKRLSQTRAADSALRDMFLDEARLGARLSHPNVVNTFEVGSDTDGDFIAMEYLEGQPLSRVLAARTTPLPLKTIVQIMLDVLAGLHYAHELADYDQRPLGIVHRDVSPQNIFVLYSGPTKLIDFGIAKSINVVAETKTGQIKGKVRYMAPEQTQSTDLDRRVDVFAAGVVLYEMLTGQSFWGERTDIEVLAELATGYAARSPLAVAPALPPELDAICSKATAPKIEDRFATARDFAEALEAAAASLRLTYGARDVARLMESSFAEERARLAAEIDRASSDGETISAGPQFRVDVELADPAPSTSRRAMRVGAILAAAIGLFSLVGWGVHQRRSTAEVEVATTSSVAQVPAPSVTPAAVAQPVPTTITVALSVVPASATLLLDGVPVANPFATRVPRDAREHTLVASAPGHRTITRTISFDGDVDVELALSRATVEPASFVAKKVEPRPSASVAATVAVVTKPPAFDAEDLAAPPSQKPTVTIDGTNPWKK